MKVRIIIEYELDLNEDESLTPQHLADEIGAWRSGAVCYQDFEGATWPVSIKAEEVKD